MIEILNNKEQQKDFSAELEAILSRTISPENIATYADDALIDLIGFSSKVVNAYSQINTAHITREQEERAFDAFGLKDLGATLDHVSQLSSDIDLINEIVADAVRINQVIVPPEANAVKIEPGNGEFTPKQRVDRLKTVLFVLDQDFEVDLKNPSEFTLTTGAVNKAMMRQASYYSLNMPQLNRQILVCDEQGNVTYVFDTELLTRNGVEADLLSLNKGELNAIIYNNPGAGTHLTYSPHFVSDIKASIGDPLSSERTANISSSANYLNIGEAPKEGYLSLKSISKQYNVGQSTVQKAARELNEVLGDTIVVQFRSRKAAAYSPEQQKIILDYLEQKGIFVEPVSEGFESVAGIARQLGISHNGILSVIEGLSDALGEVKLQKFRSGVAKSYSPEQQQIIRDKFESEGRLTLVPDGYKTVNAMASEYGLSNRPFLRVIESRSEELGEVLIARANSSAVSVFSPDQQQKIYEALVADELFLPHAPEEYVSHFRFAEQLGMSRQALDKLVGSLGDALGDVRRFKFGSQATIGYAPGQQNFIRSHAEVIGTIKPIEENEGYKGTSKLAEELNVSFATIQKAVVSLTEALGPIEQAKFGNKVADAYSPAQQELIYETLKNNKRIKDLGSLAMHGM